MREETIQAAAGATQSGTVWLRIGIPTPRQIKQVPERRLSIESAPTPRYYEGDSSP
jgi:hypothetical protein